MFLISEIPLCLINLVTDIPQANLSIITQPIPYNGYNQPIWMLFMNLVIYFHR